MMVHVSRSKQKSSSHRLLVRLKCMCSSEAEALFCTISQTFVFSKEMDQSGLLSATSSRSISAALFLIILIQVLVRLYKLALFQSACFMFSKSDSWVIPSTQDLSCLGNFPGFCISVLSLVKDRNPVSQNVSKLRDPWLFHSLLEFLFSPRIKIEMFGSRGLRTKIQYLFLALPTDSFTNKTTELPICQNFPFVVWQSIRTPAGHPLGSRTNPLFGGPSPEWEPDSGASRDDWMNCHGMSCDTWKRTEEKVAQVLGSYGRNPLLAADRNIEPPVTVLDSLCFQTLRATVDEFSEKDLFLQVGNQNGSLDGCIFLTEEQADILIENMMEPDFQTRKLVDLEHRLTQKWTNFPIKYKFDGKHSQWFPFLSRFNEFHKAFCARPALPVQKIVVPKKNKHLIQFPFTWVLDSKETNTNELLFAPFFLSWNGFGCEIWTRKSAFICHRTFSLHVFAPRALIAATPYVSTCTSLLSSRG